MAAPNRVTYPDGDLTLVIGSNQAEFLVCSEKLVGVSPYFNAMLMSGWAESKPSEGEWRVTLLEDDDHHDESIQAILFALVHGITTGLPLQMDVETLKEILPYLDYYDMYPALRPAMTICLSEDTFGPTDDHTGPSAPYLDMAYLFGHEAKFNHAVRKFVFGATLTDLADFQTAVMDPDLGEVRTAILELRRKTEMELIENLEALKKAFDYEDYSVYGVGHRRARLLLRLRQAGMRNLGRRAVRDQEVCRWAGTLDRMHEIISGIYIPDHWTSLIWSPQREFRQDNNRKMETARTDCDMLATKLGLTKTMESRWASIFERQMAAFSHYMIV